MAGSSDHKPLISFSQTMKSQASGTAADFHMGAGFRDLRVPMILIAYFAVLMTLAISVPFPTRVDELGHYSVIRAQLEHPTLFPDWSRYLMVREDDPAQWSATPNYINHPSLYYLLLAPVMALTSDPLALRIVNACIATLALGIVGFAACRRFSEEQLPPTLFMLMAAAFPKGMVVGGMINNDNLAALAAAALFAALLGMPGQVWWIAVALTIAGWTKLTAFIALAAVAGGWLILQMAAGRTRPFDRLTRFACGGLAIGAIPYFVTYARSGHFVWVNVAKWRVPPDQRIDLDFTAFVAHFFDALVMKWPAAEWAYPYALALAGLLGPLLIAATALRDRSVRPLGLAYLAGIILLFAIHLMFGWSSYRTMGDLTIMQARYYGILWPGVALLATMALARIGPRWSVMRWGLIALCLSPTLLGGLVRVLLLAK